MGAPGLAGLRRLALHFDGRPRGGTARRSGARGSGRPRAGTLSSPLLSRLEELTLCGVVLGGSERGVTAVLGLAALVSLRLRRARLGASASRQSGVLARGRLRRLDLSATT
ncbi:MAG: hypothetical protein U0797_11465 [Gemmataceae bacterium]